MGMTIKGVETRLEKGILPILTNRGFKKKSRLHFKKELLNDAYFDVSFNIKGYEYENFSVQAIFGIRINKIENYWEKYRVILGEDRNPYPSTLGFLITDINPELDKKYHTLFGEAREPIKNEEDIYVYIKKFDEEYEKYIIPFLDKINNLEWMDSIINPSIDNIRSKTPFLGQEGFWYKRIIIAKLANNPNYEEIYQWIRSRFQKGYEDTGNMKYANIVTVLDKVYNDLNSPC